MIEEPWFSVVVLFARVLVSGVFLVSGIEKSMNYQRALIEFENANVPLHRLSLNLTIFLHLLAPVCLIAGWWVTESAIALSIFTIAATVLVHHFWTMDGDEQLVQRRAALANLGLIGGLALLALIGPGQLVL